MKQQTIVRVKILSGTYTPEMITEAVGLRCDKWWHSGDMRMHTTIIEKDNGWILHSGLPKTSSLDAHIEALWRLLEPVKGAFRSLSITETVEVSVVIYCSSPPALNFGRLTIDRLAELGAGLDIDLYVT